MGHTKYNFALVLCQTTETSLCRGKRWRKHEVLHISLSYLLKAENGIIEMSVEVRNTCQAIQSLARSHIASLTFLKRCVLRSILSLKEQFPYLILSQQSQLFTHFFQHRASQTSKVWFQFANG